MSRIAILGAGCEGALPDPIPLRLVAVRRRSGVMTIPGRSRSIQADRVDERVAGFGIRLPVHLKRKPVEHARRCGVAGVWSQRKTFWRDARRVCGVRGVFTP